jgi:hypothetical protein
MPYPEGLDGSRDARWYRTEAVHLREWGNHITYDPELHASYFSLAREHEGLADIPRRQGCREPSLLEAPRV